MTNKDQDCHRALLTLQLAGAELEHRTEQVQKVRAAKLDMDNLDAQNILEIVETARKNALFVYDLAVRNMEANRC